MRRPPESLSQCFLSPGAGNAVAKTSATLHVRLSDIGDAAGRLPAGKARPPMIPRPTEPDPPRRRFSTEVETRLVDALVESDEHMSSAAAASLDRALKDAAREARENSIQVEELMIAFKQVEEQAARRTRGEGDLRASRVRILRTLLDAYYR